MRGTQHWGGEPRGGPGDRPGAGTSGGPGRRRFLLGVGVLGAAATVPAGYLAWPRSSAAGAGNQLLLPSSSPPQPHSLQIVAHQDDDLLFLNPDLALVRQGLPTTTVYLTAGEANGTVDGARTRTQFAADRQAGARAAYAALTGVPDQWRREVFVTAGGQQVELATLLGADHVRLVFVGLPDAGDTAYADQGQTLPSLLLGKLPAVPTLVPDGGPVTAMSEFSRDALVSTLAELMAEFRPSVVRTLDPQYAPQNWSGARQHGGDNVDHSAAARFTDLAVRKHLAARASAPIAVVNYVGYGVASLPGNVAPGALTAKTAIFTAYAASDGNVQTFRKNYDSYLPSQRYRWPAPTPTLLPDGARDTSGLSAFAVLGRQVVRWRRSGADWSGPEMLGPGGRPDAVSVCGVRGDDGRIRLFALTVDLDAGTSEIMTAGQDRPGGAFRPWQSLGGPLLAPSQSSESSQPPPSASPEMNLSIPGAPAATVTARGDIIVFAAAVDGSLHSRTLKAGTEAWPGWTEIAQADLVDVPAATAAKDGTVDVFAAAMVAPSTRNGSAISSTPADPAGTAATTTPVPAVCRLLRWRQATPGGPLVPDTIFPEVDVVGPPAVVRSAADVAVFCLTRGNRVEVLRSPWTGLWSAATELAPADLIAAPAAHLTNPAAGGSILLAGRGADATISVLEEVPGHGFPTAWTSLGGQALGPPAIASDAAGRTHIAVIDTAGRLAVASRPGSRQPFQPWRTAGN